VALSFRVATARDRPALRAVFGPEPSDEQVGLAGGNRERARRIRALAATEMFSSSGLGCTTVAQDGDEICGFVQSGAETGLSLSLIAGTIRVFGFAWFGFVRRDRSRGRVTPARPVGSYHIAELHVLDAMRNKGIGAALLAQAERDARAKGFGTMSLTTTTSNPARHLYERHGFELVEAREDPAYRAATGIAGRILMVKQLG